MKEDPRVQELKLGDAPHEPPKIFKDTQASKLGDAPASPSSSTIISSSFSTLYFYHFMCYVLCLERLAFIFQFSLLSFVLFSVRNNWNLAYIVW